MASDDSSSSTIILSFDIDEDHCGVLELIMPGKLNDAMTAVCERLAKTIGVVMAIYLSKAALAERVKELACMYSIAQVAANSELSLENSIQKVVELLPKAWQYTRIASSRISLDGRLFFSEGFCEGPQTMSAEILVGGTPRGNVEIFYSKQDQQFEEFSLVVAQPFLQEEHHLIEGVAREVAFLVERTNAEAERTALQEQVRHADRLVTIGQLAAGVAHELNEPLGSVLGFAQLLAKKPGLDDQTSRDIEKITAAALFAREIVKKLMFFARQAPTRISLVNLNQTVQSATDLLEMRCSKARIRMKRNLCSEIPDIKGDPAQLQQVIVNLVVNAIQATPEGGEIEIATGIRKNEVLLTVDDSGDGISHEHVDKVFLPFFTTKDVGQGTGLGLAVVHGIVSAHGGTVEVVPKGDKGARLRVLLPARDCKIGTQ
jgi:signal transduction histidine kinase